MNCLDEATFMALMTGGLPPARAAEVDAHLDACPSCRRMMAQALQAQSTPAGNASAASTAPSASRGSSVPEAPLPRGTAVGRYLVLERLGAGGMGVVYAAYDPELNRRIALKLLRTEALGLEAEAGRACLLREAQAMARVSHPHVVPIYDVGTFDGQVFLAMELVEARTVRQWPRDAPRSWHRYAEAAEQHQEALGLLERTLGLESLELADVLLRMSQARMAQHHGAEALDLAERALALRQRALGPEHPETGMALSELAEVRWCRNEFAEAEQRAAQALELLERSLGAEHPGLVSALNTLATARLTLRQKPETVLPLLERALRLMESSGGPENSDTAVLVNNIGTALGRAGRLAEAEKHMADASASPASWEPWRASTWPMPCGSLGETRSGPSSSRRRCEAW